MNAGGYPAGPPGLEALCGEGALAHLAHMLPPLPDFIVPWAFSPWQEAALVGRHGRHGQPRHGPQNQPSHRNRNYTDWMPPPPDMPEAYRWDEWAWDWHCTLCKQQATFTHVTGKKHRKRLRDWHHGRYNRLSEQGVPERPIAVPVLPEGWSVPQGANPAYLWAHWHEMVTRDEAVPPRPPPPPPTVPASLPLSPPPRIAETFARQSRESRVLAATPMPRLAEALPGAPLRRLAENSEESPPPSPEAAAGDAAVATNTGFEVRPDCTRGPGQVDNSFSEPQAAPAEEAGEASEQPEAAEGSPPFRGPLQQHAGARPTASGGFPKAPPVGFGRAPSQPLESTMRAPTQAPAAAPTLEEQPLGTTGTGEAAPGGINGGTAAVATPAEERASSSAPAGEAAEASLAPGPAHDLPPLVPPRAPQATPSSTAVAPAAPGEAPAAQEPRANKAGS